MAEKTHSEGWISFAAVLMGLAGVANTVFGLAAAIGSAGFPTGGVLFTTLATWGWAMLLFGVLQIGASFLLAGRSNAGRILAIVLASVSIVGWMTWLGALPFAGVAALVLDVLVIYGLSVTAEQFETSRAHQTSPTVPTGGVPAH
jgi:hypothetical protein